jgi:hypothetical protein
MRRFPLSIVCLSLAVAACNNPFSSDRICDASAVAGIVVVVQDSASNGPVPLGDVVVRAVSGELTDSSRAGFASAPGQPAEYQLAHERTGTYTVTVSAAGYRPWSRSGVKVTRQDDCHVRTQRLTALLQR